MIIVLYMYYGLTHYLSMAGVGFNIFFLDILT